MSTPLLWGLLLVAVGLNRAGTIRDLAIFGQVRYGEFLAQKWFLVVVALGFLFGWLLQRRAAIVPVIKRYWRHALVLLILVFAVHAFSYSRWFYIDDFRIIAHHYAATDRQTLDCCGNNFFPLGMIQLMLRYFGTNYAAYTTLTLLFFWIASAVLYAIARKLGAKSLLALLIAGFFLTSPTYFHETLSVNEFMGEGFTLILVLAAIYLLLERFTVGSVAFAAAALEFGLSRTHFIALPLALLALWFMATPDKNRWLRFGVIAAFAAVSLVYLRELGFARADSNPLGWSHLLVLADMVSGVTLPYLVARPAIELLGWFGADAFYLSAMVGALIIMSFAGACWLLWRAGQRSSSKLVILGVVIIVSAILVPSIKGSRVNTKLSTLTSQYDDPYPVRATAYGLFPTIGMSFVLLGLLQDKRFRGLAPALTILIVLNGLTLLRADWLWAKEFYRHQHTVNQRLDTLIGADGSPKIILVNRRHLFDKLQNFRQIFRPAEPIELLEGRSGAAKIFTRSAELPPEQFYFFNLSEGEQVLTDLSQPLREAISGVSKPFVAPSSLSASSSFVEITGRKIRGSMHLRPLLEVTPSLVDINQFTLSFSVASQALAAPLIEPTIDVASEYRQHRNGFDFLTSQEAEDEQGKPIVAAFVNFTDEDVQALKAQASKDLEVSWACFDPEQAALPGTLATQFEKNRVPLLSSSVNVEIGCLTPGQVLKNVRILGGAVPAELKIEGLTITPRPL